MRFIQNSWWNFYCFSWLYFYEFLFLSCATEVLLNSCRFKDFLKKFNETCPIFLLTMHFKRAFLMPYKFLNCSSNKASTWSLLNNRLLIKFWINKSPTFCDFMWNVQGIIAKEFSEFGQYRHKNIDSANLHRQHQKHSQIVKFMYGVK